MTVIFIRRAAFVKSPREMMLRHRRCLADDRGRLVNFKERQVAAASDMISTPFAPSIVASSSNGDEMVLSRFSARFSPLARPAPISAAPSRHDRLHIGKIKID